MLLTNGSRTQPFNQTPSQPIQQPPKRVQLSNSRQTKNPLHQMSLQVLKSQNKILIRNKQVDFSLKISTSLFLNHFTLVVTLNHQPLVNQSLTKWKQTSSSANLMNCQSVSDLIRFNILFNRNSSYRYNKLKLLMPNEEDVTRCSV